MDDDLNCSGGSESEEADWLRALLNSLTANHRPEDINRFQLGRFTLDEASLLLALSLNETGAFESQVRNYMQAAVEKSELLLRDAVTGLIVGEKHQRNAWGVVTRQDVNAWLEKRGASYGWEDPPATAQSAPAMQLEARAKLAGAASGNSLPTQDLAPNDPATPSPALAPKSATDHPARLRIQEEATEEWIRWLARGANPTVHALSDVLARWCVANEVRTKGQVNPKAGTIRNTILGGGHWTPPDMTRDQAKLHIAQAAQVAQQSLAQDAQGRSGS